MLKVPRLYTFNKYSTPFQYFCSLLLWEGDWIRVIKILRPVTIDNYSLLFLFKQFELYCGHFNDAADQRVLSSSNFISFAFRFEIRIQRDLLEHADRVKLASLVRLV